MATQPAPTFSPEAARTHVEIIFGDLEFEAPVTKGVIEAITNPDFRIDPKARTAKELAWHIVYSEIGMLDAIADLNFEMTEEPPAPATLAEVVRYHQENLPRALARVRSMTAEQLLTPLDFGGMFNFPAFQYVDFAILHTVHHRAFLAAYLRPMGSKCPSIYGGSADFPFQPPA